MVLSYRSMVYDFFFLGQKLWGRSPQHTFQIKLTKQRESQCTLADCIQPVAKGGLNVFLESDRLESDRLKQTLIFKITKHDV